MHIALTINIPRPCLQAEGRNGLLRTSFFPPSTGLKALITLCWLQIECGKQLRDKVSYLRRIAPFKRSQHLSKGLQRNSQIFVISIHWDTPHGYKWHSFLPVVITVSSGEGFAQALFQLYIFPTKNWPCFCVHILPTCPGMMFCFPGHQVSLSTSAEKAGLSAFDTGTGQWIIYFFPASAWPCTERQ